MMTYRRHLIPRRLSYRWFATRGWAFGGFWAFLAAAIWLRPADLPINAWVLAIVFGNAALGMFGLSCWPESTRWRLWAVAGSVSAATCRSWALLMGDGQPVMSRVAASAVWLFLAYACWLLAMFTANVPNRRRKVGDNQ